MGSKRPHVLVAVDVRGAARLETLLQDWAVERVATLAELARRLTPRRFDLIVVGAHFDNSHGIEAVKLVLDRARGTPLACVRAFRFANPLGQATLRAFRAACEELGADVFIDVLDYPDDEAGNARLRAELERLIAPP